MSRQVLAFNRAELQVISEKEAAALLSVSPGTLGRMREANIGPPWVRISLRRFGYRLGALKAFLEAREQGSSSGKVALADAA